MPQDPFKIDQIQIEPGSGETLLISRDSADGSLRFTDNIITAGLKLSSMCGLRMVDQVRIVGKAGSGAQYTTVQSALDSISLVDSGVRAPNVVLITPGVYTEDITIDRDGVVLLGLGSVVLESASEASPDDVDGANHTISITTSNVAHPPKSVALCNLTITNSHQGKACVHIQGDNGGEIGLVDSSLDANGKPEVTFGHGGVWITDCRLMARQETTYQVYAALMNNLYVSGGSFEGSHSSSLIRVEETAKFVLQGVDAVKGVQVDYDGAGANFPATLGSSYLIQDCSNVGAVDSELVDAGSLTISGCPSVGNVTFDGNRELTVISSVIGDLDTDSSASLINSTRGAISGTGTLSEPHLRGTLTFTATDSESLVFGLEQPDANYTVLFELPSAPAGAAWPGVSVKASTGFTVAFTDSAGTPQNQTMTIEYMVLREM